MVNSAPIIGNAAIRFGGNFQPGPGQGFISSFFHSFGREYIKAATAG